MLSIAAEESEEDWDLKMPTVMFVYRSSVHESTGETPFSLMFGREAQLPADIMYNVTGKNGSSQSPPKDQADRLRKRLSEAYTRVRSHLKKHQNKQKFHYDARAHGKAYKKGDLVWLHCPAVPRGCSRKLHRPWRGPYVVIKVMGDAVYRIKLVSNSQQRKVVHYNRLKPYEGSNEGDDSIIWAELNGQPETDTQGETSDPALPNLHEPQIHRENEQNELSVRGQHSDDDVTEGEQSRLRRSTRNRRPPQRFGSVISFPDSDPFPD
jgi:hypothetical protein